MGAILALVLPLTACSGLPELPSFSLFSSNSTSSTENEAPPEQLYNQADALLGNRKYEDAAKRFNEVDRQHPYSPYARRAVAMSAYAYYKAGKYPEAIQGAKRYTTLHPGTKESALAQHIIASSYFDQISPANQDQSDTRRAVKALETLIRQYPESRYAVQARNRLRIARDVLAASEMNVGRYYLKRHNYLAAINRFKTVVIKYQTTAHVEEALARLTEAYMAMGITNEAQTAAAVLGHNFPESKWYQDSYVLLKGGGLAPREDSGSWISKAWKSTVSGIQSINPL